MFVLSATLPAAMGACPKAASNACKSVTSSACSSGTCKSVSSCAAGNCNKNVYSQPCTKNLCVVYLKCTGNEYIQIKNGASINKNLKGYKITISCKNCATRTYTIPGNLILKPGQNAYIFTCSGKNSGNNRYMGVCGDVLKCSGMTVTLKASCGKVLSTMKN